MKNPKATTLFASLLWAAVFSPLSLLALNGQAPANETAVVQQAQVARFNVVNIGPQVEISWVSLKEINAGYYTIERSSDGVNFIEVTRVNAAGDSPALLEYFEADRDPLPGVSYYRLKQTTRTGEFFYSEQMIVKRQECGAELVGQTTVKPMDAPMLLNTSAFGNEEILVVVRDKEGKEFVSKVMLMNVDGKMVAYDPDGKILDGEYTIISSSNDDLQQRKLKVD